MSLVSSYSLVPLFLAAFAASSLIVEPAAGLILPTVTLSAAKVIFELAELTCAVKFSNIVTLIGPVMLRLPD